MDSLCNPHYVDTLQCPFCCLSEQFEYSLICKRHLLVLLSCNDCLRIRYHRVYVQKPSHLASSIARKS